MSVAEYHAASHRELERWPGATIEYGVARKHGYAQIGFNGLSRKVFHPMSPSDGIRGALQHTNDIREALRAMGAVRTDVAKSHSVKRQRNVTQPRRLILEPVQRKDRWLAPLAAIKAQMEHA
jgi:hypothetical protein